MSDVVYFSKMFQAVPQLAQVASQLPGTFVTSRSSTMLAARRLYPALATARYRRWLGPFSSGAQQLKKAEVIVTGSPYRSFLQPYGAKKCTVFHGTYMMLSKHALLANAHFDLLCVTGPRMQQMIRRFAPEVELNTVMTGYLPFCEFPERSVSQRNLFLKSLGLDPGLKTIVYAPSRRGEGSWDLVAESLIKTAPPSFNIIMRPHPSQSLSPRRADRASFRRVASAMALRPNALLDLTSQALSSLLSVADLLISDASSPAEESLFYDIPQLFIETPLFNAAMLLQQAAREGMHDEDAAGLLRLFDCGSRQYIDACIDFSELIMAAIDAAPCFAERRNAYFSWVFGERGREAHRRVANAITTQLLS